MSGEVQHFEIPYDKADRAKKFYSTVFGWKMDEVPEMEYTLVRTGPVDDKGWPTKLGNVNGGMMKRKSPVKTPVITITVDDIDATLKMVLDAGGKSLVAKMPVGQMGWSAYFKDSEGNVVGLFQRTSMEHM